MIKKTPHWENVTNSLVREFLETLYDTNDKNHDLENFNKNNIIPALLEYYINAVNSPSKEEDDLKYIENFVDGDALKFVTNLKKTDYSNYLLLENKFTELVSKYGHIARQARKYARSDQIDAATSAGEPLPDTFDYLMKKATGKSKSLTAPKDPLSTNQIVELIKQLIITYTTTSHPTNPTSVEYTKATIELDEAIEAGSKDLRKRAFKKLINTDITPLRRKKVSEEFNEGLATVTANYQSPAILKRNLIKAINNHMTDKNGYSQADRDKVIKSIPNQMMKPHMWFIGDGDGNPNQNAENMKRGLKKAKEKIWHKYKENFDKIKGLTHEDSCKINTHIINKNYKNLEPYLEKIIKEKNYLKGSETLTEIENFLVQVQTFQDNFVKIEVRHNAKGLMTTQLSLLDIAVENNFIHVDAEVKAAIEKWQKKPDNENATATLQALGITETLSKLQDNVNDKGVQFYLSALLKSVENMDENDKRKEAYIKAERIFGRIEVIAEQPEVFNDLIIAEAENPIHGQTALKLLEIAGYDFSKTTNEQGLNIVLLFEFKEDLNNALKVMDDILKDTNSAFYKNAMLRGEIPVMIAKSDTVRTSGAATQYNQEEAMAMLSLLSVKYDLPVVIYHGGGDALMRGGGKITELPYVQGSAIMQMFDPEGNLREIYKKKFTELMTLDKNNPVIIEHWIAQGPGGTTKNLTLDKMFSQRQAAEFKKSDLGTRGRLTLQGHQGTTVLTGSRNAVKFIEGWLSQQMNAIAKQMGFFKRNEVEQSVIKSYKEESKKDIETALEQTFKQEEDAYKLETFFYNGATTIYREKFYDPHKEDHQQGDLHKSMAVLGLFFPAELIGLGGLASRPIKRGENVKDDDGYTLDILASMRKENVYDQRAIGLDKTSTHSGTHFTSNAGLIEGIQVMLEVKNSNIGGIPDDNIDVLNKAMKQVKKIGIDPVDLVLSKKDISAIRNIYQFSQTFRNTVRTQATTLAMKDFQQAWDFVGEKRVERNSDIKSQYQELLKQAKNTAMGKFEDSRLSANDQRNIKNANYLNISNEGRIIIAKAMLVYQEELAFKMAEVVYAATQGAEPHNVIKKINSDDFTIKTPLRKKWKNTYDELEYREHIASFSKKHAIDHANILRDIVLAYKKKDKKILNRYRDEAVIIMNPDIGKEVINDEFIRTTRNAYAGIDVRNNPISLNLEITKDEKRQIVDDRENLELDINNNLDQCVNNYGF